MLIDVNLKGSSVSCRESEAMLREIVSETRYQKTPPNHGVVETVGYNVIPQLRTSVIKALD
jgi:hypothetical protein